MSAVMATQISADVLRWRERFDADGLATVVATLAGHIELGDYGRLATSAALAQLAVDRYDQVDVALHAWLEHLLPQRATETDDLSARELAGTLGEAFRAVALLPLPITRAWLQRNALSARLWLASLRFGDSRDPALPLYAAIAVDQPKQDLERFWLGLCRLPGGTPDSHGRAGIVGLTGMPKAGPGLPRSLFSGLLDYAEALARRGRDGETWHAHMGFLSATQLVGADFWTRGFREALQYRRPEVAGDAKTWLEAAHPKAFLDAPSRQAKQRSLEPPPRHKREELLARFKLVGLEPIRPALRALVRQYQDYTKESGDSYYLSQSFNQISDAIREADPTWARELAHESVQWHPSNHTAWSKLARALQAEGDWRRAQAVYWHARRRFPDNDHAHNQLAHALLVHGQTEDSLAILREAMQLFPDTPVCVTDYAMALRELDREPEAIKLLETVARERFPSNLPTLNLLTDLLLDTDELTTAEGWLSRAEDLDRRQRDHDPKIDFLRQRLKHARAGEALPKRRRERPIDGTDGDLDALHDITGQSLLHAADHGRAVLYRRAGRNADAATLHAALPVGAERAIETGLLLMSTDPHAAARHFAQSAQRFAGDGVFQVHALRARVRIGETPDWTRLSARFPYLRPVMDLDPTALPPISGDDHEAQLRRWLDVRRNDTGLRDPATEDWLSVYQIL